MSVRSAVTLHLWGLSPRTDSVRVERDVPVRTRDGQDLLTDIWRPSRKNPLAAVVIRTPYGRKGLSLLGELLAERGHLVVVQSCRGTFGSSGTFFPFTTEKQDGEDTLSWLRWKRFGTERIVLAGASYMGHTAYAALGENPVVQGAVLAVTTSDFRNILRPHHVFGSEGALTWIEQLVHQEAPLTLRLRRLVTRQRLITRALAADPTVADKILLGAPYAPYQEWIGHADDDPWWQHIETASDPAAIPPCVQIAGWFDPFLEPQLADYQHFLDHDRAPRLIIGPWTHGSAALLRTFVDETDRMAATGKVGGGARIHLGGSNSWHEISHWPPVTVTRTFSVTTRDIVEKTSTSDISSACLRRPVVTDDIVIAAGGCGLNPRFAGRRNQRKRERLESVLTTSTGPLTSALTIAGSATVQFVDDLADRDHDWFIRLCDVDEAGRSFNVCDGFARVRAAAGHTPESVTIALAPTAHMFKQGHALRLQISRSGQPWYERPSSAVGDAGQVSSSSPGVLTLPVWVEPTKPVQGSRRARSTPLNEERRKSCQ